MAYLVVLWFPSWLIADEPVRREGAGYIMQWVLSVMPNSTGGYLTLAVLLIWLQGLIINYIVLAFRMGPQANLFAGLALAWLYSCAPEFTLFGPVLLGNTFVALVLLQVYALYRRVDAARGIFNAGALTSLAALCFFPMVALLPAVWLALGHQRGHNFRETLQFIIGAVMPWMMLYLIFFWAEPAVSFGELAGVTWDWPLQMVGSPGLRVLFQGILLMVLILMLLTRFSLLGLGETIQVQKNISIAYGFMLAGAGSLLFSGLIYFNQVLVLGIPMALLLGLWMGRAPVRWVETVHFLLLIVAILYQYFPLQYL